MLCATSEIIACLEEAYNVSVFGEFPESVRALKKLPREPSEPLRGDCLYACTANDLSAYPPGRLEGVPLLCTIGLDQTFSVSVIGRNSIILLRGVYLPDVIIHLAGAMFDMGMKEAPLSGVRRDLLLCRGPQEMLKTAYKYLKAPVFLTTATMKILSHSDSIEVNPIMEMYSDGDCFSAGLRQAQYRAEAVMELSSGGRPDHYTRELDEWFLCSFPLFEKKSLTGWLLVFFRLEPPDGQQMDICLLLRNILEREAPDQAAAAPETEESFIGELIRSRVTSEEHIADSLARLRWIPKRVMHVMVLSMNGLLPARSLRESRRLLSDALPGHKVYSLDSGIIILYQGGQSLYSSDRPEWLVDFGSFLSANGLCAGISGAFSSFTELSQAFSQASMSMQTGAMLSKDEPLHFYEDMAVFHMIELAAGSVDISTLLPEGFNRLVMLDRSEGRELIKTLAAYLDCGRNISKCAEKLFVHVNTVKYRIKQISGILHCDLRDGSAFFRTALAVRILLYIENCRRLDHPYSQLQGMSQRFEAAEKTGEF